MISLVKLAKALLLFAGVRIFVMGTFVAIATWKGRSAHEILSRWDAQWYRRIAEGGYGHVVIDYESRRLHDYAFFPLFPALERVFNFFTHLTAVDSGILISCIASIFAAAGIYKIAEKLYGARIGLISVLLWAIIPIGIVQTISYSDSLFTALAVWAFYAALNSQWMLAGGIAFFAGLTRPVGIAVAVAIFVTALLASVKNYRNWVGAFIAPLGWLGYILYVAAKTHNLFGYFKTQSDWGNGFDGGVSFTRWIWKLLNSSNLLNGFAILIAISALIYLLILTYKEKQPLALLIFTTILVFISLTTAGAFGSKPRYLLPAFPLLFPLASRLSRRTTLFSFVVLLLFTLIASFYGAHWLLGSGPL